MFYDVIFREFSFEPRHVAERRRLAGNSSTHPSVPHLTKHKIQSTAYSSPIRSTHSACNRGPRQDRPAATTTFCRAHDRASPESRTDPPTKYRARLPTSNTFQTTQRSPPPEDRRRRRRQ